MRVAVIGLGGVGGYLAASLSKTSHEIVGFARGEHLQKIQNSGLEIIEDEVIWNKKLDVRTLESIDGYFDIVLFCVKSYSLKESYKKVQSHIDEKTVLLSFSNGVENGELLKSMSSSVVLDAAIYILSHIEKSGTIRKKGKVFSAIFGGEKEASKRVKSLFIEADLRVKTPENIKEAIWKKYIFISAFATLTTFYEKSMGYINEYYRAEALSVLQEIAEVAKALGVDVEGEVENALQSISKVPYDSNSSMYLDFKNNRESELESLSAYIVKKGEHFKVETPYMKKMYEALLQRGKS